jgi:phage terminase small subunit
MSKLSPRQKQFARNLIKTNGRQGEAYKMLSPSSSDKSAQANASRMLANKPEIKQYLVEVLERKGLGTDELVGKLKRLTNAKKENILPSGEIVKTVDNSTRLHAVTTGLKLHGHLTTNVHVGDDNRSVLINVDSKSTQEVNSLTDKLNELHGALALDKGQQDGEILDADFSASDDTSEVD